MRHSEETQGSDPADPLHELSVLRLFPRTFRVSKNALSSNQSDDLESIHGLMKSMAMRSPSKYLEQAKTVADGNSEFLNYEFASSLANEKKDEDIVVPTVNENARERRPGLGRRRARFSLKLDSSQPSMNLEPTLDIDHLQDPEEFFLAHEKFENARKELMLMRGGSMADLNDLNKSKTERRRRPGILGKTYKHSFASMLSVTDNTFMSSQEISEQDILSPLNHTSQPETADPNVKLQGTELNRSMSKTENRGDGLLDELLSDKCENLDKDGIKSILRERLQIKPLDLDKLCLPEFHDVGKNDFMDLGKISRKPRKALADIQNLTKGISDKTPVTNKQVGESPVLSPTSPTPPKSPFAAISLLKKSMLQSDLQFDPFSALDLSPARNSPSVERVEQSDHHVRRKKFEVSGELKSLTTEIGETRVDDVGSRDMITGESITPCENFTNDKGRLRDVIDVLSSGSEGVKYTKGSKNVDGRAVEYNDSRITTDTDAPANGSNEMEETMLDIQANKHGEMEKNVEVSGELKSLTTEIGETRVDDVGSRDMITGESITPCENFTNDKGRLRDVVDVLPSGSEGVKYTKGSKNVDGRAVEYNDSRITTDTDAPANGSNEMEEETMLDIQANKHGEMEKNVGDMLHEAGSSGDFNFGDSSRPEAEFQTDRPHEMEETVIQTNVEDTAQDARRSTDIGQRKIDNLDGNQSHESRPAVEPHAVDASSKNSDALPEEHVKEPSSSRVSLDEQSPAKRPARGKRKTLPHRPSLAGCGMSWEDGVKRSKRIKMRPLEFWRGERFLYGRINESLKVIGVKYMSPAKGTGGKPELKVKSYVSEEYKELVELAALH